jgi:hypothetical protein
MLVGLLRWKNVTDSSVVWRLLRTQVAITHPCLLVDRVDANYSV